MAFIQVSLINFAPPSTFKSTVNHVFPQNPRIIHHSKRNSQIQIKCCLSRTEFPPSFKFGASTSALQTESGPTDGGRGPSTWDIWIADQPAVDSLHKYNSDVLCLKYMNMDVYRFSISWPRLFPTGKVKDGPNPEGVKFYNDLINDLLVNGIEPYATIFHFDMSMALQDAYNGFLSRESVYDYNGFADFCFKTFGDRVKRWCTFNDTALWCDSGYSVRMHGTTDLTTDPYIVAHNILLAHATAVKNYRENYESWQHGKIGIVLKTHWYVPRNQDPVNIEAARRAWDFCIGWFLEPLVTGNYPSTMQDIVRDRLPKFTNAEKKMIKHSYDFIGLNYYSAIYVEGLPINLEDPPISYSDDQFVKILTERDGRPVGPSAGNGFVYPPGIYKTLMRINTEYKNPEVYIMKNGYADRWHDPIPIEEAIQDYLRIDYIKEHLKDVRKAIREGANVRSYLVWSLMDCIEFGSNYNTRFGLCYCDYSNNFNRIPKKSATWFKNFLAMGNGVTNDEDPVGVANGVTNDEEPIGVANGVTNDEEPVGVSLVGNSSS